MFDAEVWQAVNWWIDWDRFRALPYGGVDLMAQPQFVVQAIKLCELEATKRRREIEKQRQREQERLARG